jgi:hypothetical protein
MFTIIFHALPVGGRWMPTSSLIWWALTGWLLIFLLGYLAGSRFPAMRAGHLKLLDDAAGHVAWIMIAIAALGAILVVFDFVVLRGYGFDTSAALIRALETEAAIKGMNSNSAVSGIGRLALPAAFPAFIIVFANKGVLSTAKLAAFTAMVLIILYEQLFFEGGRFYLTAMVAIVAIVAFIRLRVSGGKGGFKLSPKLVLVTFGVGSTLLFFFSYVFVTRILDRGDFFWSAYRGFTMSYAIAVDVDIIARLDGLLGPMWFSLSMLWIYLTQGINEFDQILQMDHFNHAHSLYQYPHFGQIAQMVAGIDWRYDLAANLPTTGTYLTLPGANYVDFGISGMLVSAFIFGAATSISFKAYLNHSRSGVALCAPLLIVTAVFSPVVSLFTTLWPAFFWSFVASLLLSAFERRQPRA